MGGNALKDYETSRLAEDEYRAVVKEFSDIFEDIFGFLPVEVAAYRTKETFGDADLLLESSKLPPNWKDILRNTYNLTDNMYFSNGDVTSIGFKNFQFDLIKTNNIYASKFYLDYNDISNLIGRIHHKLGVKFGFDGLSVIVRHKERSDHIIEKVFLTDDHRTIYDIVGLDYDRYLEGFDTLEDIFEFVASSKYFDPDIYQFDNRSQKARMRDKKRITYHKFLQWIDEHEPESKHSFANKSELGGYSIRMPYYETELLPRFPWLKDRVDNIIHNFELDLKFKEIYNGKIVSDLTGYTGKTLGAFMSKIKPSLTNEYKQTLLDKPYLVELMVSQLWTQIGGINFSA